MLPVAEAGGEAEGGEDAEAVSAEREGELAEQGRVAEEIDPESSGDPRRSLEDPGRRRGDGGRVHEDPRREVAHQAPAVIDRGHGAEVVAAGVEATKIRLGDKIGEGHPSVERGGEAVERELGREDVVRAEDR